MFLDSALQKNNNNLDVFRVIAASMVIYGHAYALLPAAGGQDFLLKIIGFDYSGSLAVKIFFFLSGLVVTNSLISSNDAVRFVISRFFRIWPALLITLGVSAFVIGPVVSSLSAHDYFSNPAVMDYFVQSAKMNIRFELPGVFQGRKYASINGSLWTIPFEVFAYVVLLGAFMSGGMRLKKVAFAIVAIIIVEPVLSEKIIFTWVSRDPEVSMLAPSFASGALLAIFRESVKIDLKIFVGLWVVFYVFKGSVYGFYYFYGAVFYSIIYLATLPLVVRLKPSSDISYGVYLWGWPVQQLMVTFFPDSGVVVNQVSSIAVSAILGWLSWNVIEKRFIAIGSKLGEKVKRYSAKPQDSVAI